MTTKSYFLVRDFDCPPDDAIQLGHILSDHTDPLSSLNADERLPLPPSVVKSLPKTGFSATRQKVHDGKFGLWAQILEGATFGGGVGVNFSSNKNDVYTVQTLVTSWMWLAPAAATKYVEDSVKLDGVQRFLKGARYKKPVYMITGLKVAKGAAVNSKDKGENEMVAKLMADGTAAGLPLKAGPQAQCSATVDSETAFETAPADFVFAYQLRKLTCSKKKATKIEEHIKGAMFDSETQSAPDELEIVIADTDVIAAEVNCAEEIIIQEQDGENEVCIILTAEEGC